MEESENKPAGKADLSRLRIERETPSPPLGRPSGLRRKIIVIPVFLLLLSLLIFGSRLFSPEGPIVETIVIQRETVGAGIPSGRGPVLTGTGYVMPKIKAAVSPRVTGQLVELFIDVGSRVKKGDLLGRLANDDLRAQERQIKAEIESQKALLQEARVNMEDLKLELGRQESLYQAGAVSPSSYEKARAAYRAAEARVSSAEARLENARATLEVVRAEIEKTFIRAPFDGAILRKEAEVGEIVGPVYGGEVGGDVSALVTLCDMSSLEVEVDVNEAYISRLTEGMEAAIVLDALPDHSYPGAVRKIVPTADRQKATVQVKVALREIDDRVLPEMGAKVSFYGKGEGIQPEPVMAIPAGAIHVVEGRAVVFTVDGGKVKVNPIAAGHEVAGMVPVFSGLSPGQMVIVKGPEGLSAGQKVRIAADESK